MFVDLSAVSCQVKRLVLPPSSLNKGHLGHAKNNAGTGQLLSACAMPIIPACGHSSTNSMPKRPAQVYKRLQEIDADSAEAKAATILAGLSFTPDMQVRPPWKGRCPNQHMPG